MDGATIPNLDCCTAYTNLDVSAANSHIYTATHGYGHTRETANPNGNVSAIAYTVAHPYAGAIPHNRTVTHGGRRR